MKNRAVFFDRDGTLNEDPGYLGNPLDLVLFEDAGYVLASLKNDYHFKLIVVSNQSGIDRGLLTQADVISVNDEINKRLLKYNVMIDAFYYCPFHPEISGAEKSICRKPSPKMIFDASKDHDIDLSKSYLIGDSASDIEAGINAGVKSIIVMSGNGAKSISILHKENIFPSFVADNLTAAFKFIINDFSGENFSD